jgi:hypothetical protein
MNPLTVRQSFQASNVEALRMANGVNELMAREAAAKKLLEDRTNLEHDNVAEIPKADPMRTEERRGREGRRGEEGQEEAEAGNGDPEAAGPVISAEGHMDFLI